MTSGTQQPDIARAISALQEADEWVSQQRDELDARARALGAEHLPLLLAIPEAGHALSVSEDTVRKLVGEGRLERVVVTVHCHRITRASVVAFIERGGGG